MELTDAVRRRRMVRAFTDAPVPAEVVDALCELAGRAPSAGNSQGVRLLVLDTPDAVAAYWDTTLPVERRVGFRWPGLITAPVLVVVAVDPGAYVSRYGEADKVRTGLGAGEEAWPVPYWFVDGGAAIEHLLLGAVDAGLGACLFGVFHHEAAVRSRFGFPEHWRLAGTIALGHPAPDEPGRSAGRARLPVGDFLRRGTWAAP